MDAEILTPEKKIDEIIEAFELLDPWRTRYPDERKYTWRQSSPIKQSRLFLLCMILYVSIYLSKTTFQSPHNKILVFEKVNTFCNIILNSEGVILMKENIHGVSPHP
jgi:hypothetical protein